MRDNQEGNESEDRASRLRERRNQVQQKANTVSESTDGKSSEPTESASSESDDQSEGSVKDERIGTYMYLQESQQKELKKVYNQIKAEYEYEYDTEFEKNRQFYPLVVEYGIQSLDSLDVSEIQERLESLDIKN